MDVEKKVYGFSREESSAFADHQTALDKATQVDQDVISWENTIYNALNAIAIADAQGVANPEQLDEEKSRAFGQWQVLKFYFSKVRTVPTIAETKTSKALQKKVEELKKNKQFTAAAGALDLKLEELFPEKTIVTKN